MKVMVRFFASYRERAGTSQVEMELPNGATAKELLTRLRRVYTSLPLTDSVLIAVNAEYVSTEAPLHEGDEVVFIPPVSGG
ncbi:MAG: molybdopterin converting factor subunit 1 [Chloroflexi bacterium]|nr:molybdopterin converting factor subunit 1 [Chloroflexota bacterium]